ncbi:MAG TPA: hypothetical protein DIW77_05960 [Chromatiaceae bacterium]|jgi:hypothetical protein|nr:MAG: hypothetical protein N838_20345 [Thiohalocapsa sp. PB-PSB1]HCS89606.1 hypothetical protein [Chromatiaceae bacterium]
MNPIQYKWQRVVYNYRWSDYVGYIDDWIPKIALSVPIVGYLILFNDRVSDMLVFKDLTNEQAQRDRRPFTIDAVVVLPDHLHCKHGHVLRCQDSPAGFG